MAQKIVAGNWKMNLDATSAQKLVSEIVHMTADEYQGDAQVIFSPSFPFLSMVHHQIKDHDRFHLSGQNLYQAEKGAFTGEVAPAMLSSVGCSFVILGHSERRQYFNEDNALLAQKIDLALAHHLRPIYCIGETLADREAGNTLAVNQTQLSEGAFHLSEEDFGKLVIAYEPVWAIGTGVTASPEQAQEVHAYIRKLIAEKYSQATAVACTILYGGSVKPHNAQEIFAQADIDGGLIGGASLKSRDFVDIIKSFA
ncbi:MAG: triose-phosphate isomerase [Bacteroidota bacterium]